MVLVYKDRVKMTVSGTPGTGTITLGSAVAGFRSFADASIADGSIIPYSIVDGASWETGIGTYTTSGTTLTRTVHASSTGSAISLTSAAVVAVSPTAYTHGLGMTLGKTYMMTRSQYSA